jgi:hypothetical protein
MASETGECADSACAENRVDDQFRPFELEVLNAQWLPQPEIPPAPVSRSAPARTIAPDFDAEAFLRRMYLLQE